MKISRASKNQHSKLLADDKRHIRNQMSKLSYMLFFHCFIAIRICPLKAVRKNIASGQGEYKGGIAISL